MAEHAPSPHARDTLADIERMWNRLAVQTEVYEAIRSRSEGAAFGPEEVDVMARAYEAGLEELGGQLEAPAELLARTIVRLAEQGERDPTKLQQQAVQIASRKPSQT